MKTQKHLSTFLIMILSLYISVNCFSAVVNTDVNQQESKKILNFKDADISGNDLSGRDLSGADFENAKLVKTNLSGTILKNANFKNANLENADLRQADLTGADLTGANLRGADLRGAILTNATLTNVDITNAIFESTIANLQGPKFMLGPNLSFGFGRNVYSVYASDPDSDYRHKFSSQATFRMQYFFLDKLGVMVDVGYNFLQFGEESSGVYEDYHLHYLFFTVAPIMRINNVYFFFGPYLGFPIAGSMEDNFGDYSDASDYTMPDLGLNMGAGYMFKLSPSIYLYTGINLKYEITAFKQNSATKNRYLAVYVDFSLLFDM